MTFKKLVLITSFYSSLWPSLLLATEEKANTAAQTKEELLAQPETSAESKEEELVLCSRTYSQAELDAIERFNIKKINSWTEVDTLSINSQSLVITDIDQTLIQPSDSLAWNYDFGASVQAKAAIAMALRIYPKLSSNDVFMHKVFCDKNSDLIEPSVKLILQNLRARKVGVIACSTCSSEKTFAYLRAKRLAELGIEFGLPPHFCPTRASNAFTRWQAIPWCKYPMYYSNIIFTDHVDAKGPIIGAFLDATCPKISHPKRIVFIDDLLHNHISLAQECARREIKFQGYLYTRNRRIPWNVDMVMFQLKYLAQKGVWLRDSVAQHLYNKPTSKN